METFGIRIYKEYFNFAAAHFLIFEDGTREELHGHNYHVQMAIEGRLSDSQDIFIDFLHVKPIVKRVCDTIDHRTLLPRLNPLLHVDENGRQIRVTYQGQEEWVFPRRDVVLLPIANTSAERLAQYLCLKILEELHQEYPDALISQVELIVEESRGQAAVYRQEYSELQTLKTLLSAYALA